MGTGQITTGTTQQTIFVSIFNALVAALKGDLVPRNTSGIAEASAGSVGTAALPWLKAHIASGYFSAGNIQAHNSYNGLLPMGQGWMLCDGRIVNQANYDLEHGAGSWATYIGSSLLNGKYLPNMTDAYLQGAATTPETGTLALTRTGSNSIALAHQHTHEHNHQWLSKGVGSNPDKIFNSDGNATNITAAGTASAGAYRIGVNDVSGNGLAVASYTALTSSNNTSTALTDAADNNKPLSNKAQFYMRII